MLELKYLQCIFIKANSFTLSFLAYLAEIRPISFLAKPFLQFSVWLRKAPFFLACKIQGPHTVRHCHESRNSGNSCLLIYQYTMHI